MTTTHTDKLDFNGDGFTDILWERYSGDYFIWNLSQDGLSVIGGAFIPRPDVLTNTWHLNGLGQIAGDATTDLLWQSSSRGTPNGYYLYWQMQGDHIVAADALDQPATRPILAVADVNGDGKVEALSFTPPSQTSPLGSYFWQWMSDRPMPEPGTGYLNIGSADFAFTGVGDFNGDGKDDMLFRGTGDGMQGRFLIETLNVDLQPTNVTNTPSFFGDPGPDWTVRALADFNGDGSADILWTHTNGAAAIWLMQGNQVIGNDALHNFDHVWDAIDAADYNNDGKADLLWRDKAGNMVEWLMDGTQPIGLGAYIPHPGDDWTHSVL